VTGPSLNPNPDPNSNLNPNPNMVIDLRRNKETLNSFSYMHAVRPATQKNPD